MNHFLTILDGYACNPGDLSWDGLQGLVPYALYDRTAPEQVVERALDATMILTNKVPITAAMMAALPRLQYIGVMATGYNIVDVDEAHRRGIVVTNVPAYSTVSVAQLTIAHLLNIVNSVAQYAAEARHGVWSRCSDFSYISAPVMELAGKTLGIVGLGDIGAAVTRIARALGMRVQALSSKSADALAAMGVDKAPNLDTLLSTSDVVSLHCPLTPTTRHMISARELALMRPNAILLNTARGPLIDEDALAQALRDGTIMAAGLDVMETEPPAGDNPLLSLPNCHLTPHVGWASAEARLRLMTTLIANIRAFLHAHPINTV